MTIRTLLALSFLTTSISMVACGGSTTSDNATTGGEQAISAGSDDLVACKKVVKGSGKIHVFQIPKASKTESDLWHKKLVAVGMSGTLSLHEKGKDEETTIGYSQGEQPDIESYDKHGDEHELVFSKKQCAGSCKNSMTTSAGWGEEEEETFINLTSLKIDDDKKTLHIEGEIDMSGLAPNTPWSADFTECDVNKDRLRDVKSDLN